MSGNLRFNSGWNVQPHAAGSKFNPSVRFNPEGMEPAPLSKSAQTGQAIGAALPGMLNAGLMIAEAASGKKKGKKPPPPVEEYVEEEASVWPWVIGGVLLLGAAGGGLYLATRSS